MTRFKPGDRVRVVNGKNTSSILRNGDEYTVLNAEGNVVTLEFDQGLEWSASRFELVNDDVDNAVVAPNHYQFPNGVQVKDITQYLNFFRGSAVKYIVRAGRKDPTTLLQDLRKGAECLRLEIERLENESD